MGFFSTFFKSTPDLSGPEIQFGRFTDTYKSDDKYESWDKSIEYFEHEKYLQCYASFLDFLTLDSQKNVTYAEGSGRITFTIYQGSKIIYGFADFSKFVAEAKIVKTPNPPLGLMRMLLEENFNLKYARYALDEEECICLKFDTYVEDGSPHKIYQALKELATEADRKDDVLQQNFDGLLSINNHHTRQISTREKKIKYDYFIHQVHKVTDIIDQGKLNAYLYPGGISFLLLDFLYKIDYLIKPEGSLMENIAACHDLYFSNNAISVHDKNKEIIRKVRQLEKLTFDDLQKELYEVNSTFGIAMPEGQQRLIEIIDAQMTDFDWYYDNKFFAFSQAICGYVVGFSLYSYSLPEPSKDLLKLYFHITENEYFKSLGYAEEYCKDSVLVKKNIVKAVRNILEKHKKRYPGISADTKILQYDDASIFARSYLIMLRNIVYPEI